HNQDKVSMGTIAARDCLRVLELTEQVAAALTLASVQGVRLRRQLPDAEAAELTPAVEEFICTVGQHSLFVDEDRPLEAELRAVTGLIRNGYWDLYADQ
ncbi:MAG: aromatic amino acid lyase, partial [Propionivibrio sp.]